MAIREFNCMYNPETKELTYGHLHGCSDGFENIKVIDATDMPTKEEIRKALEDMKYHLVSGGICDEVWKTLSWLEKLAAE